MLDVRKLVLLREVDARGSIAAAAEAVGYTRSAVSQQLSALAAETGVPLLDRANGRAELTAAGRVLVEHTERIVADLEKAETTLRAVAGRVAGTLRVGLAVHHGPPVLLTAVRRLRTRHPSLDVRLHQTTEAAGRQAVRLGQLDVAFASGYRQAPRAATPGVVEQTLAEDGIRLVVAADDPLAAGSRRLADFAGHRWAVPVATDLGRLTVAACHNAGFEPDVMAEIEDPVALLGLASSGLAVALLPDLMPDRPEFPVARVRLADVELTRRVFLVTRRGAAGCPTIAALTAEITRAAAELLS